MKKLQKPQVVVCRMGFRAYFLSMGIVIPLFATFLFKIAVAAGPTLCVQPFMTDPITFRMTSAQLRTCRLASDSRLLKHQKAVRRKLRNVEPTALIKRQLSTWKRMGRKLTSELVHNHKLVQQLYPYFAMPASALEKVMLEQLYAYAGTNYEFSAQIFESANGDQEMIFYVGGDSGVAPHPLQKKFIAEMKTRGYRLKAIMHNHPFKLSQQDVGGVLVPSGPDVIHIRDQYIENGTEEAWITNGFYTLKLPAMYAFQLNEY